MYTYKLHLGSLIASSQRTEVVCIDEQLILTCRTNRTTLKWAVSNPHTRATGVGEELISSTQVVDALLTISLFN